MGESADAVVIGGGIIGANIAFQLARRGLRKVVVLEKSGIAAGASGKGGATVGTHFNSDIKVRLAQKSLELWVNFNDVYRVKEQYYERSGQVCLGTAEQVPAMQAVVEMQRECGVDACLMSEPQLRELAPQISLDGVAVITYEPDAGIVDPLGATSAVAEAAHEAGADVRVGIAGRGISVKGGRVDGVKTDAGAISSPLVFNAAYVWAPRLLKPLGVRVPITPVTAQIGLFRRPGDFGPRPPAVIDLVQGTYMHDYPTDLMLVGSMRSLKESVPPDPDDYQENANWSVMRSYRENLWRRFPAMRRSAFRGGYSGINDITPDSPPIIDRVPGAEGLFVASGFSGVGFCFAPAVGQLLAEWALDGSPSLDIATLSLERFANPSNNSATGSKPLQLSHRTGFIE